MLERIRTRDVPLVDQRASQRFELVTLGPRVVPSYHKTENFFLLLDQSAHPFLLTCVSPHTHTDGMARIFFSSFYAVTRNQTHVSSVAPLLGTLTQDALPTELPRPRLSCKYKVIQQPIRGEY